MSIFGTSEKTLRIPLEPDRLVADVGGTNTRVALVQGARVIDSSVRSFSNGAYSSFDALLAEFASGLPAMPKVAAISAAGPKSATEIRLTNRDWAIIPRVLVETFGFEDVGLFNDLEALGHSLPHLGDGISTVYRGQKSGVQSLVVGIGTGFNVCPVTLDPQGRCTTFISEMGHMALPSDLCAKLSNLAFTPKTFEDVFSGRGYLDVFRAATGAPAMDVHEATRLLKSDEQLALTFGQVYGSCLALLVRNLTPCFLPYGGIYFAGSVARSALGAGFIAQELDQLRTPEVLGANWVPDIHMIEPDDAALGGLATVFI